MLTINFDRISTLDASTQLYRMTNINIILISNISSEVHRMISNGRVLNRFELKMFDSAHTHF